MPQSSSENYLVSTVLTPVRLDSGNLVVHDDTGYHNRIDLEELNYTNRELVNLENAAVNIENSSDVIIGPVTQFNVNGNVTIYQNGQQENQSIENENREEEEHREENPENANLPKPEKNNNLYHKKFVRNKAFKILVSIIMVAVLISIVSAIVFYLITSTSSNATTIEDDTNKPHHQIIENYNLISKAEWNGRPPKSFENITHPVKMIIIKHTGGSTCHDFQKCAGILQTIQSSNVASGMPDIYCSFLVAGDGSVYEGRGFDAQPENHKDIYDIAFMGNYDLDVPTNASLEATKALLRYGVKINKIAKDYIVVNHNQTKPTQSPGINLKVKIMEFPHYDPGLYFSQQLASNSHPEVI